jgi:hypothetical protein
MCRVGEENTSRWVPKLMENNVDLETLSSCRTDDDFKNCGITAIGDHNSKGAQLQRMLEFVFAFLHLQSHTLIHANICSRYARV